MKSLMQKRNDTIERARRALRNSGAVFAMTEHGRCQVKKIKEGETLTLLEVESRFGEKYQVNVEAVSVVE